MSPSIPIDRRVVEALAGIGRFLRSRSGSAATAAAAPSRGRASLFDEEARGAPSILNTAAVTGTGFAAAIESFLEQAEKRKRIESKITDLTSERRRLVEVAATDLHEAEEFLAKISDERKREHEKIRDADRRIAELGLERERIAEQYAAEEVRIREAASQRLEQGLKQAFDRVVAGLEASRSGGGLTPNLRRGFGRAEVQENLQVKRILKSRGVTRFSAGDIARDRNLQAFLEAEVAQARAQVRGGSGFGGVSLDSARRSEVSRRSGPDGFSSDFLPIAEEFGAVRAEEAAALEDSLTAMREAFESDIALTEELVEIEEAHKDAALEFFEINESLHKTAIDAVAEITAATEEAKKKLATLEAALKRIARTGGGK